MKKYIFAMLVLMLTLVLLCGCQPGDPETLPTEQGPTAPSTEPSATYPVEEDVFYFSNALEYDRLYSQRLDGSDLKLVVDEKCSSVFRNGDTVYFMVGDTLKAYRIPTAESTVLVENVLGYSAEGEKIAYLMRTDDYFIYELHFRDLATGKDISICAQEINRYAICGGRVYYCYYDYKTYHTMLCVYDTATHLTTTLADEYDIMSDMVPTAEGVYFSAFVGQADQWFYASADGTKQELCSWELPEYIQVASISDKGILYIDWNSDENWSDSVKYMDAAGNETTIIPPNGDVTLGLSSLGDDRWLVTQSKYEGWGETNEYGYQENFSYHYDYQLLHEDGTLTQLNGTGTAGTMFADGDFPVIDSSTARKPVTAALYNLFVGGYDYEGAEPVCSTTHGAWLNIADRKVDLALLAAPTEEERAYLREKGVNVEMKLYGGDGLVFIGNAANPVTDLTHEQILAIYRGEITNWSEVGGPDQPISVYYRDDQSGSQRLFESLVFKGEEIPDFSSMNFYIMDEMSTLVGIVLSDPYAIGYSIMTYLDDVYAEEELQVFAVNGVTPSVETIMDQSYPYNTRGYLVIRSDEPENSPARRLFDWFGCPISDDLLTDCSVSPLHEAD